RKASFFLFFGYRPSRLGADEIEGIGRPTKRQKQQHDDNGDQESVNSSHEHLPAGDSSSGIYSVLRSQDSHPTQSHKSLPTRSCLTSIAGSEKPAEKDTGHTKISAISDDRSESLGLTDGSCGGQEAGG